MEIEPYVVDVLMPDLVGHDRHPSAFLVYLYLYRHREDDGLEVSLSTIAENTGLSKRSVQSALARLEQRRLIRVERPTITSLGRYFALRPWIRDEAGP